MIIDSHQHFWIFDAPKHTWMNERMDELKKDFLPNDYISEIKANGMDGSVAVQASQSEEETEFLVNLASKNDFIKAVVGWVDLRETNIENRLAHFAEMDPIIKGFRHVVHDEPDLDFMLREDFQNGISLLKKYNFAYDILIFPTHLEVARKLVYTFPDQKFVIDHIAKPYIAKGEIDGWKRYMSSLGKCDNVYCKLSGLVTEAKWGNWEYEDFEPYLDVVVESFGIDRLMFGSDWPVCLLSGSYSSVKGIVDRYLSSFSNDDKAKVLGLNAIQFYNI